MPGRKESYAARPVRSRSVALALATLVAGTLSTVVQVVLWMLFADGWPTLLVRDARLAAAVVLGPAALPPPATFDPAVMAVATAVHFALSLAYTALVAVLVGGRPMRGAMAIGAGFGVALYVVNMHGFTWVYPWFAQARGWIALVAHVAFGVSAAAAWRAARRLA